MLALDEKKEFNYDITITDIKRYFREHNRGPVFSMFEAGLDNNRFDLIRIVPHKAFVRIYEFKSCRRDFLSDKKWENYLEYCHTFTFVCPRHAIERDDLPAGIGLMWIYKWRWKGNENWLLESHWVKRTRKREMDKETLTRLAFMLVHRTKWRKEDVF